MNKSLFYAIALLAIAFLGFSSSMCEKEPLTTKPSSNGSTTSTTTTTTISKPEVRVSSRRANSDYDGWWVIGTVTTGGDSPDNVNCYLEWSIYGTKQTGTVSLTHRDKMNVTNRSSNRVQFKKEHAGVSRGSYIYFRLVGSNSKYTTTTTTEYMVATSY